MIKACRAPPQVSGVKRVRPAINRQAMGRKRRRYWKEVKTIYVTSFVFIVFAIIKAGS